jgi:hypothetical protein
VTAIRSNKESTALTSWRVVIASRSRWWEKRHYELKVRPVGELKPISSWVSFIISDLLFEMNVSVVDLCNGDSDICF